MMCILLVEYFIALRRSREMSIRFDIEAQNRVVLMVDSLLLFESPRSQYRN